jgi:hypothetical protein
VDSELERTWKKRSLPNLRYYPSACLEGLRNTTKTSARIVGVSAEVRTGHLPNASQKRYRLGQFARFSQLREWGIAGIAQ